MTDAMTIIELDPATVAIDPKNARRKLEGIAALAESMKVAGQLVPVLVTREGETYRLVAGHRRRAAAERAGLPLWAIEAPNGNEAAAALAALVENDVRQDLNLIERAAAHQRALDLGVNEADLAKATGATKATVGQLRKVHGSKAAAAAVKKLPEVTLEQAAALAEFEDDPEALAALTYTLEDYPPDFDHEIARRRRNRAEMAEAETKLAVFREAGVRVLDPTEAETATQIVLLTDDKGKGLTAKGHQACPGNAVALHKPTYDPPEVRVFCTDPDANGHQAKTRPPDVGRSRAAATISEEERETASAERKAVLRNNRELETANEVRREYVAKLCQGKATIPGLTAFVASQIVGGEVTLGGMATHTYADAWKRLTGKTAAGWAGDFGYTVLAACKTDRDYTVALFSAVAAYHEATTDKTAWRHESAGRAAYLTFLETTGYALSEQERMIVTEGTKRDQDGA